MRVLIFLIICFLFPSSAISSPLPLGIDWFSKYKVFPSVDGYRYYFGDLGWGKVIYLGKEDFLDMEVELQIDFATRHPTSAVLVFGTAGLNRYNCTAKYREVVRLLTEKYKFFRHREVKKDPLVEDLFYVNACTPVLHGLYEINTEWFIDKFHIVASLFGDGEFIWIEIQYNLLGKNVEKLKKISKKKKLERL